MQKLPFIMLTETISTILSIIALSLVILLLLFVIIGKIRRKFLVNVNCWFCNQWSKVPYNNQNCFDCPQCLQYNGFTKDGDYNKVIPEQRDEFLNKAQQPQLIKSSTSSASNGLCKLCNNNQQLKIFQLAHFVPLVESNYDVEIEHFAAQLEKAYKLCKKCDRLLKETIGKQHAWLFGKHLKNSIHSVANKLSETINHNGNSVFKQISVAFIRISSLLCATLTFLIVLSTFETITNLISIPNEYQTILSQMHNKMNLKMLNFKLESIATVCSLGFLLQFVLAIVEQSSANTKLNRFLCWIILFLCSYVNKSYAFKLLPVQTFCYSYLVVSTFASQEKRKRQVKQRSPTVNKFVRNLERTCSDFSSLSNFDDLSQNNSTTTTSSSSSMHQQSQPSFQSTKNNTANKSLSISTATFDNDINNGLIRLRLGSKATTLDQQQRATSPFSVQSVQRPKPVLSPPKFVSNWVANTTAFPFASNMSRSSSESSGFGSQINDNYTSCYDLRMNKPFSFIPNYYQPPPPNLYANYNRCGASSVYLAPSVNNFSSRFSSISAQDDYYRYPYDNSRRNCLFKNLEGNFDKKEPELSFSSLKLRSDASGYHN